MINMHLVCSVYKRPIWKLETIQENNPHMRKEVLSMRQCISNLKKIVTRTKKTTSLEEGRDANPEVAKDDGAEADLFHL